MVMPGRMAVHVGPIHPVFMSRSILFLASIITILTYPVTVKKYFISVQ